MQLMPMIFNRHLNKYLEALMKKNVSKCQHFEKMLLRRLVDCHSILSTHYIKMDKNSETYGKRNSHNRCTEI